MLTESFCLQRKGIGMASSAMLVNTLRDLEKSALRFYYKASTYKLAYEKIVDMRFTSIQVP
jgi:hypothetical protein